MSDTKDRILQSATKLFMNDGYEHVSLRQIATDAGVEPSLIIRHFDSKDALFIKVIHITGNSDKLLNAPREDLGRHIVQTIVEAGRDENSNIRGLGALLSVSSSDRIKDEMRANSQRILIDPLIDTLEGSNKQLRAYLIATQIIGLLLQLHVIDSQTLKNVDESTLIEVYGKSLQALIDD